MTVPVLLLFIIKALESRFTYDVFNTDQAGSGLIRIEDETLVKIEDRHRDCGCSSGMQARLWKGHVHRDERRGARPVWKMGFKGIYGHS